jgi:hypothetical protein
MPKETVMKAFTPEMAGERVGWVAVAELPASPDMVRVDIVTATVSNAGARLSIIDGPNGEIWDGSSTADGFLAVAGLYTMFDKSTGRRVRETTNFRASQKDREKGAILRDGGSYYPDESSTITSVEWAENSTSLVGKLKEAMQDHNLSDQYPEMYHLINGYVAHDAYRRRSQLSQIDSSELFLVDRDCKVQLSTHHQEALATAVVETLVDATDNDELMRKRLTVFSDITAAKVPKKFEESRRLMRVYEQRILSLVQQSHIAELIYLPVGFRPNGRTWPYMDPTVSDEKQAFGDELTALINKNVSPATVELDKEITELALRFKFAQQGADAMRLLHLAEESVTQ